ncbi:hypothetical protein Tco_0129602 [Tanacetum coccineum]
MKEKETDFASHIKASASGEAQEEDIITDSKERLNSAKVEVNTEVKACSADEEDARKVHLDALLAKRIQEEQELSEQQ